MPQDPNVCDCDHYRGSHRSAGAAVLNAADESILQGLEGLKFVSETQDSQLLIPQDPESASDWPKVLNMKLEPDLGLREFKAEWADRFGSWLIDPLDVLFVSQLGVGSSSIVYEATYKSKQVAVKVMNMKPMKMKSKAKQRQELLEEFSVLTSVESSHVLKLYGIIANPVLCLVTEFCAGGTLRDLLDPPPFVPVTVDWKRGLQLFLHALHGVNALHSRSPPVVHRDLKSLNLLVDSQMQLKVSDFGLSRFLLNPEQQTTLAKLRGTYTYTAPEVYFGSTYSIKSDMYSLGVVLWEIASTIATGKWARPFAEYPHITMDFQVIIQVAKKNLRPTIAPGTPPEIREIIEQLWSPDPEQRPSCTLVIPRIMKLIEYSSFWKDADSLHPPPAVATTTTSVSSSPRSLQNSRELLLLPPNGSDELERAKSDPSVDGGSPTSSSSSSRRRRDRTRSVSDPPELTGSQVELKKSPAKPPHSAKKNK